MIVILVKLHIKKASHVLMPFFSTQEVILKNLRDSNNPYLCFFDLEKAFDFLKYSTLLTHIFQLGVNGKCWHILRNWYSNALSVVKINQTYSDLFPVSHDVKQGSVLSPTLFIAVMDSLLSFLESSRLELTVYGFIADCSAHADDVRAASIVIDAMKSQGHLIDQC